MTVVTLRSSMMPELPTTCVVPASQPYDHHHPQLQQNILHYPNSIQLQHHSQPKGTIHQNQGRQKAKLPNLHYSQYNTNNTPTAHTSPSRSDRQTGPAPQVWHSARPPSLSQCCALQHRLGSHRRRWQECLLSRARGLGRWTPLLSAAYCCCCFRCFCAQRKVSRNRLCAGRVACDLWWCYRC
jgi:hypothetical protein